MMKQIFALFFCSCCSLGCTVRDFNPDAHSIEDMPTTIFDAPICSETTPIETDPNNCGRCGNSCNMVLSDRCVLGGCQCGLSPPCSAIQECRFGTCRDSDPTGAVCEFDGNCPGGNGGGFGCINGHCSRLECAPEQCDGLDNDCDGYVDGTTSGPLSQYCFDEPTPAGATVIPPCRRGAQLCVAGAWSQCEGSVSPRAEAGTLACDGLDNNCDGCIDGVLTDSGCYAASSPLFDVVYAIDTSGSMLSTVSSVIYATRTFSDRFAGNPSVHLGIVLVPGSAEQTGDSREATSYVLARLSTYELFIGVLTLDNFRLGTGLEPSWDVVYELGQGDLDVGWRPGATRIIILFTDEPGQSHRSPDVSESEMCYALEHGESLYYFTTTPYRSDWDDCGTYFPLTTDHTQLILDLDTIIADPCGR